MKTVNTKPEFESISTDQYIKYIEQAEMLHQKGLLLEVDIVKLDTCIYEKGEQNENNINQ